MKVVDQTTVIFYCYFTVKKTVKQTDRLKCEESHVLMLVCLSMTPTSSALTGLLCFSLFLSAVLGKCSAAEIELKKQQAMERRRQKLQASQNLRAPTWRKKTLVLKPQICCGEQTWSVCGRQRLRQTLVSSTNVYSPGFSLKVTLFPCLSFKVLRFLFPCFSLTEINIGFKVCFFYYWSFATRS